MQAAGPSTSPSSGVDHDIPHIVVSRHSVSAICVPYEELEETFCTLLRENAVFDEKSCAVLLDAGPELRDDFENNTIVSNAFARVAHEQHDVPVASFTPFGLPSHPYYKVIARRLYFWILLEAFPLHPVTMNGFEKSINHAAITRITELTPDVMAMSNHWSQAALNRHPHLPTERFMTNAPARNNGTESLPSRDISLLPASSPPDFAARSSFERNGVPKSNGSNGKANPSFLTRFFCCRNEKEHDAVPAVSVPSSAPTVPSDPARATTATQADASSVPASTSSLQSQQTEAVASLEAIEVQLTDADAETQQPDCAARRGSTITTTVVPIFPSSNGCDNGHASAPPATRVHSSVQAHASATTETKDEKEVKSFDSGDDSSAPLSKPVLLRTHSATQAYNETLLKRVLEKLGIRGMLTLLGLQCTTGSIERFPPSAVTLYAAFNKRHSPDSSAPLSVGARALSKHYHRSADRWWGELIGNDSVKNSRANALLHRITDNSGWLNVHTLPHDVFVYEVRCEQGYGARWTADGEEFRGFLEPQMEDGHEQGWRH